MRSREVKAALERAEATRRNREIATEALLDVKLRVTKPSEFYHGYMVEMEEHEGRLVLDLAWENIHLADRVPALCAEVMRLRCILAAALWGEKRRAREDEDDFLEQTWMYEYRADLRARRRR